MNRIETATDELRTELSALVTVIETANKSDQVTREPIGVEQPFKGKPQPNAEREDTRKKDVQSTGFSRFIQSFFDKVTGVKRKN